jgi:hypothetical protein
MHPPLHVCNHSHTCVHPPHACRYATQTHDRILGEGSPSVCFASRGGVSDDGGGGGSGSARAPRAWVSAWVADTAVCCALNNLDEMATKVGFLFDNIQIGSGVPICEAGELLASSPNPTPTTTPERPVTVAFTACGGVLCAIAPSVVSALVTCVYLGARERAFCTLSDIERRARVWEHIASSRAWAPSFG